MTAIGSVLVSVVNLIYIIFYYQETLTASVLPTVGLGAVAPGPGRPLSGFEPLANQRLLPPTFPRVTEIRERDSALQYLQASKIRLSRKNAS